MLRLQQNPCCVCICVCPDYYASYYRGYYCLNSFWLHYLEKGSRQAKVNLLFKIPRESSIKHRAP